MIKKFILLIFLFQLALNLHAQEFFDSNGADRDTLLLYFDRADLEESREAWLDMVSLGLAASSDWEREELDRLLGERLAAWEGRRLMRRFSLPDLTGFLTEIQEANLQYLYETVDGKIIYDRAGDPVLKKMAGLEGSEGDQALWNERLAAGMEELVARWEREARVVYEEVLRELGEDVRGIMQDELTASFDEYKNSVVREYERLYRMAEHHFLFSRLRDSYSLRKKTEAKTAEAIAESLIRETEAELNEATGSLRQGAAELKDLPVEAVEIGVEEWQEVFRGAFEKGIEQWNRAELRFFKERIRWETEAGDRFVEAERAWDEAFKEFSAARKNWGREMGEIIEQGRVKWNQREEEFLSEYQGFTAELLAGANREALRLEKEVGALLSIYRQSRSIAELAQESIEYLQGELDRSRDLSYSNTCREQLAYWQTLLADYSRTSQQVLDNLGNIEQEIKDYGGAGFADSYANQLKELQFRVELLKRQLDIAAAVVAYAGTHTSDRPTEAETEERYERALKAFLQIEAGYLGELEELKGISGQLSLSEKALIAAKEALEEAREALRKAEEQYKLNWEIHVTGDPSIFEALIQDHLEEIKRYQGFEREEGYAEYFSVWEAFLRKVLFDRAEELIDQYRQGSVGFKGLAEIEEIAVKIAYLKIDWQLSGQEFKAGLEIAGLSEGDPYFKELLEAYRIGLESENELQRDQARRRGEYYLQKIKEHYDLIRWRYARVLELMEREKEEDPELLLDTVYGQAGLAEVEYFYVKACLEKEVLQSLMAERIEESGTVEELGDLLLSIHGQEVSGSWIGEELDKAERIVRQLDQLKRGQAVERDKVLIDFLRGRDCFTFQGFNTADLFLTEEARRRDEALELKAIYEEYGRWAPCLFKFFRAQDLQEIKEKLDFEAEEEGLKPLRIEDIECFQDIKGLYRELYGLKAIPAYLMDMIDRYAACPASGLEADGPGELDGLIGDLEAKEELEALLLSDAGDLAKAGVLYRKGIEGSEDYLKAEASFWVLSRQQGGASFEEALASALAEAGVEEYSEQEIIEYIKYIESIDFSEIESDYVPLLDGDIGTYVTERYREKNLYEQAVLEERILHGGLQWRMDALGLQERISARYIMKVRERLQASWEELASEIYALEKAEELLARSSSSGLETGAYEEAAFYELEAFRSYLLSALDRFGQDDWSNFATGEEAILIRNRVYEREAEIEELKERIIRIREELSNWEKGNEQAYSVQVEPVLDQLERCKTDFELARAAYRSEAARFGRRAEEYQAQVEAVDKSYKAYQGARYELQEAGEIRDYALSGYGLEHLSPEGIYAGRLAEYERTLQIYNTVKNIYGKGEAERAFAERNPEYARLKEEEVELTERYYRLMNVYDQLLEKVGEKRRQVFGALSELGEAAGDLFDIGPGFKPDFEAGAAELTDFSNLNDLSEQDLVSYFSDVDGRFSRDICIWLYELGKEIGDRDLRGEAVEYFYNTYTVFFFFKFRTSWSRLVEDGLMGLLKQFGYAYYYETGEVAPDIYSNQYFRELKDKLGANPDKHLHNKGRQDYNRLKGDPRKFKLYSFFKTLLQNEKILFDTAFMGKDLSYTAVEYMKGRVNAELKNLSFLKALFTGKLRYRRRLKYLRSKLGYLDGGVEKGILARNISDFGKLKEDYLLKKGELAILLGDGEGETVNYQSFSAVLEMLLGDKVEQKDLDYLEQAVNGLDEEALQSNADLLTALIDTAGQKREDKEAEIIKHIKAKRAEREYREAEFAVLLAPEELDWDALRESAVDLYYNPEFSEEDYRRAELYYAARISSYNLGTEVLALEELGSRIIDLYRHKLGVMHENEDARFRRGFEQLKRQRLQWEERTAELYETGMQEWSKGFDSMLARRKCRQEEYLTEYEERKADWDKKYELFKRLRKEWVRGSAEQAVKSGSEAVARAVGLDSARLLGKVEGIDIPDMRFEMSDLSGIVEVALGGAGLRGLVEHARDMTERIDTDKFLVGGYLPRVRSHTAGLLALEAFESDLTGEIERKAVLLTALEMRKVVEETKEGIEENIGEANKGVAKGISDNLEAAGYRKQSNIFQRKAMIDKTLLGGIEEERQRIEGYRYFQAPVFEVGVDLSERSLEGLSSAVIQAQVNKAVENLKNHMQLIFGQAEADEVSWIGDDFKRLFAKQRMSFERSAQYNKYQDIKGLFNLHVGYAPEMKSDNPEGVEKKGFGEYGRIFELFLRNEARLARGLSLWEVPWYELRLWDDDADNDGQPDSWFHAPTARGVIDIGTSIIAGVLTGGIGALALNLADDALFGMMDVAGGRVSMGEAALGIGKKAASGVVSQGIGRVFSGAMDSVAATGLDGVLSRTMLKGAELFSTNLAVGAINSVEYSDSGGWGFNNDRWTDSLVGQQALVGYASGISGTFVAQGLGAFNLASNKTYGFSSANIGKIGSFNRTMGNLTQLGVEYALSGETTLNVLNFQDFAHSGPSQGMLELHLGGEQGSFFKVGGSGVDFSASRIAEAVEGLSVINVNRKVGQFASEKVGGTNVLMRALYSFGDECGEETFWNLIEGVDRLHIGLVGSEGKTVLSTDGSRDIYLRTVGDDPASQLYAAVVLQHEAHRDGRVTLENYLETREAVKAKTEMATRMIEDYGDTFILQNEALVKDFIAHEMTKQFGDSFWNEYLDASYDSSEDFARIIKNWKREGRVGVMPTEDAGRIEDLLFGGFEALARTSHLTNRDDMDLTARKPSELEDLGNSVLLLLTAGSSYYASGLNQGFSATRMVDFAFRMWSPKPSKPNGSLASILNFSTTLANDVAMARNVMNEVLRDHPEEYQRWHYKWQRDTKIFGMAEKLEMELSVEYDESKSDEYYKMVEQQMVERYLWMGNKMFNDKITDSEDLKMLFYGPYVDVFDEELGLKQYQRLPGYIDREYGRLFGMADHSVVDSDFYKEYTSSFDITNLLNQRSYLFVPNNWSRKRHDDVISNWEMYDRDRIYYYGYTSDWEIRYKNFMLRMGY